MEDKWSKERVAIELEEVRNFNTSDILYDSKLKKLVKYGTILVDIKSYDVDYIRKNCFRLKIVDNN
jgi:hypothetical protein